MSNPYTQDDLSRAEELAYKRGFDAGIDHQKKAAPPLRAHNLAKQLNAMRERAEAAEERLASVSGVTREDLAKREYERGLAVGGARVAELTSALKATLCLSDACRCYGCGVARKVLASEVTP